jgi:hypothetical protein
VLVIFFPPFIGVGIFQLIAWVSLRMVLDIVLILIIGVLLIFSKRISIYLIISLGLLGLSRVGLGPKNHH